jgi:hypothetical protein
MTASEVKTVATIHYLGYLWTPESGVRSLDMPVDELSKDSGPRSNGRFWAALGSEFPDPPIRDRHIKRLKDVRAMRQQSQNVNTRVWPTHSAICTDIP